MYKKNYSFKKMLCFMAVILTGLTGLFGCGTDAGADYGNHRLSDKGTITFSDNNALLTNKGMGWNMCYYSNQIYAFGSTIKREDFLDDYPCDIVFFRVGWNYIEPEEGKFNWDFTDSIAEQWWAKGKRSAYCWVVTYPGDQSTPLWVRDAGANGVEINVIEEGKKYGFDFTLDSFPLDAQEWMTNSGFRNDAAYNGGMPVAEGDVANYRKTWVPSYDDPVFLEKYTNFLAAAAQRYDGKEYVEFVEMGSIGSWGEGHTHMSWPAQITSSMKIQHINMYNVFKSTPVLVHDALIEGGGLALETALANGMGMIDCTVQVPGISSREEGEMGNRDVAAQFWDNAYVGLENHPYTIPLKTYYDSINQCRASYARIHNDPYLSKASSWTDKITLRLGYRFNFIELGYKNFGPGRTAELTFSLKNTGAAPNYIGGTPALRLVDASGNTVAYGASDLDVSTLKVAADSKSAQAETGTIKLDIPSGLPAGEYTLLLSVDVDGKAYYNLPLNGGQDKMYEIAKYTA